MMLLLLNHGSEAKSKTSSGNERVTKAFVIGLNTSQKLSGNWLVNGFYRLPAVTMRSWSKSLLCVAVTSRMLRLPRVFANLSANS